MLDSLTINGQPLANSLVVQNFREWQPLEIACAPVPEVVAASLTVGDLELGPPTSVLGDQHWRWRWNPQHAVGHYEASLRLGYEDGHTVAHSFTLRIVPRKIDAERYEALLASIQQDARALVYALSGGRAGAALHTSTSARTMLEEVYTLVERHVAQAVDVVKRIDRAPQSELAPHTAAVQLGELERIEPAALAELPQTPLDDVAEDVLPALQAALRQPGRQHGGPLPRTLGARRSHASHDVVEHRVLRHVLRILLGRVGYVRSLVRREQVRRQLNATLVESRSTGALNQWLLRCDQAAVQLRWALSLPWLERVGPLGSFTQPTQLMRREPRYRRLYQLYRELRKIPLLAFDSPLLWLPIRDLPLLYEQWCTLRVVQALLPLGNVVEQSLVELTEIGRAEEPRWTCQLPQARPLLVLRLADDLQAAVWYQRRYQPSGQSGSALGTLDPFVRIPDIAIEVTGRGCPARVLVLDAKYRVAPDGGIPQDALDDAYAYRSAIGVGGIRATLGAWLLFPGSVPLMTADHVGALPLLPETDDELGLLLRRLLSDAANEPGSRP